MKNPRMMPFQGPRLIFFSFAILFTFSILTLRMYDYQIVHKDEFQATADGNAIKAVPLPAPRGVIYDRNGVALAQNSPAWIVTVTPASLPDDAKGLVVLNRLSALVDVPATRAAADAAGKLNVRSLEELVGEGERIAPYRAVVVKTDVDQAIAQQILEDLQNLPGVDVQWGAVRQYPTGATTSQLIGYLGPIGQKEADVLREQGYNPSFERTGFAGLEASMNDQLSGERGRRVQKVDVAGRNVEGGLISEVPAKAGMNIKLSIDLDLQRRAQSALLEEIDRVNLEKGTLWTESGVVISMNPQNGEILAMVSIPTYDNQRFARFIDAGYYSDLIKQSQYPLINHAVSSTYPPGSTWKILTSVGVVNEKVIDPKQSLFDSGSLTVKNSFAPNDVARAQKFVCWTLRGTGKGHDNVDLVKALAVSCDVYYYQVGGGNPEVSPQTLRPGGLGIVNLDRYASAFGVGEPTLVEMVGAESGNMPDPDWKRRVYGESWSTGDTYNAAFGQGYVVVTPLQLANVAAAIANGGTLYRPTLINSFVDSEGNPIDPVTGEALKLPGGQPVQNAGSPMRTLVLPPNNGAEHPAVLMFDEDMKVRGKDSISCICEDSNWNLNRPDTPQAIRDLYGKQVPDPKNPNAKVWVCDPLKVNRNYRPAVYFDRDVSPIDRTGKIERKRVNFQQITYTVFVPFDYIFTDGFCVESQFGRTVSKLTPDQYKQTELTGPDVENIGYTPPFVDADVFTYIEQGMRYATKGLAGQDNTEPLRQGPYNGTAGPRSVTGDPVGFNLPAYGIGRVETAGKTGTAEYCDNLAAKENLCIPGSWPAHAWFIGYAPAEKPEIVTVALVYHGNEGAVHALPIVRKVTDCYFKLKDARAKGQTYECKPGQDVPKPGQ